MTVGKETKFGYAALHYRVYTIYGNPKKCDVCNLKDKNRKYHWANLTGKFEDIDDYKRMCISCHRKYDNKRKITYFDSFSGIGGFALAIQDIIPNAECVGFSEIDKYAKQIYLKHFPDHKDYGDITQIDIANLPDF